MNTLKNPYCTVEAVQAETENKAPDVVPDFISAINQASRWVEWYCRRDWLRHDHATAAFTVPPEWVVGDTIYFPWPISSLTKIEDDGGEVSLSDVVTITPPFGRDTTIMRRSKCAKFSGLVKLYGVWGYATTDNETKPEGLPDDIERAVAQIAAIFSGKTKKEIVSFDGNRNTVVLKTIPKETLATLDSWRFNRVIF